MDEQRFKLGQEVEVQFIGRIDESYLWPDGKIFYAIRGIGKGIEYCRGVPDSEIYPLPEPPEVK